MKRNTKRALSMLLTLVMLLSAISAASAEEVHSYAPAKELDKFYDGAPVAFDPETDLLIDGGETPWDAESMSLRWAEYGDGGLQYLGDDAEGNPLVPTLPGQYALTILESAADGSEEEAAVFPFAISWSSAEILEVTNYSHYYHTGQYYEGAFVLWKNNVILNGVPIQEADSYYENYSDELLEAMGIRVVWLDGAGNEAVIDYDSPNSHYFNGPARVGRLYNVEVTQTIGDETRVISEPCSFSIEPTIFYQFTDYDYIESGARYYLYSIMGEMDGQLYAMAMPDSEATCTLAAILVFPTVNGAVTLGYNRENVFALQWKGYTFNDHRLYLLTTGTAWDIFITGDNAGSISRGRYSPTGDEGFYIDTDPNNNYAATLYEPNMGHGPFLLAKDGAGNVFFTRGLYNYYDNPRSDLGIVQTAPVYLYWNQEPQAPPVGNHDYEFLGMPYDKEYDGEPVSFDESKNISVDSGKTSWADLVEYGEARLVWMMLEGKEWVILKGAPSEVGAYMVVIQEQDKKDWINVLSEYFEITGSAAHTHSCGDPAWTWRETAYAAATFTCTDCTEDPAYTQTLVAVITSQPSADGKTITYTATVNFDGKEYTDTKTVGVTYTVRFLTDGGSAVDPQTVAAGEKAVRPGDPAKADWWFGGWYADEALGTAFDFDTAIIADTSVYAKWVQPDLVLPADLTTVEEEAFLGGAFTFVKLSDNTTSVGPRAFAECPNLAYIYIPDGAEVDPTAFSENVTVFRPVVGTTQG